MNGRPVRLMQSLACSFLFLITASAIAASVSGPVELLPNSYYLQPDHGGHAKLE